MLVFVFLKKIFVDEKMFAVQQSKMFGNFPYFPPPKLPLPPSRNTKLTAMEDTTVAPKPDYRDGGYDSSA